MSRPPRAGLAWAGAALLLLAACAHGPAASPDGTPVTAWVTRADKSRILAREDGLALRPAVGAVTREATIEIDDRQRYQRMAGFGASITDASAWLIQQRMNPAQREALLRELFTREGQGVGFDFTRLTIGGSDFSRSHYTLADAPAGQADPALARFSIEPMRAELLPVVRRALALNPTLRVMASPWSAPAWMKTNGSLVKGALRPDMHDAFARYLVRYVEAMAAEGVPIFALTVQNEPHFEPDDYPGMRVDAAARAALVGRHLGPRLRERGLATQIIDWDHNWDEPASPLAVLADPVARRHIQGVAWHCYVADTLLPNQSVVRDAHPDKDVWLTECSGGAWKADWADALPLTARNLIIRATRHWARGVLMWNLALDERHGPHLGGCKDCFGLVTIDSRTGEVTRMAEYYAFAHASKFVRVDAERIATTEGSDGLDNVAFRNADDGSIVLIVANSARTERRFSVRHRGGMFAASLAPSSVATYTWRP